MPFKSKAQIAKFGELVKQGKMKQATFDEWMKSTPDAHQLPERKSEKVKPVVDPKRIGGKYK
jgi:hypothetical protein